MKHVKAIVVAICFMAITASFSIVASASESLIGSTIWCVCPSCNNWSYGTINSLVLATPTSSGSGDMSFQCGHRIVRTMTRYWSDFSEFEFASPSAYGPFDVFNCGTADLSFLLCYQASTCVERGVFNFISISRKVFSTSSLGVYPHSYVENSCTPATCTTFGSMVFICSFCRNTKTETIPALGHDYITTRTDPTCTTPGSIVSTCSRCQDVQTEPIPALDHDWQEAVRADPTCTTPGSITSTCSRCQDTQTETLPTLYHSWESGEIVPSTYDEDGSLVTEGYTFYNCSSCGSSFTAVAGSSPPDSGAVPGGIGGEGMPDTTAALGKTFLSGIWSLFAIGVPGFGFTFGQMWLGVLLASLSILVVRIIFGFGGGPRGDSPRTSSTNNPRISKERRHDEY